MCGSRPTGVMDSCWCRNSILSEFHERYVRLSDGAVGGSDCFRRFLVVGSSGYTCGGELNALPIEFCSSVSVAVAYTNYKSSVQSCINIRRLN